jgi:hypothetical protein
MAKKPTKQAAKKPAARSKTPLARITERDLEVPAGAAGKVKGGYAAKVPKQLPMPPLVPIPTKPLGPEQ